MKNATSDTKNIRLGACSVIYKGKNLGLTKGGVDFDVTTQTHETTVDQEGENVISETITKRSVKVMAPLAETTLFNLVSVMPGAELIEVGGAVATASIAYSQNPYVSEEAKQSSGMIKASANPANNTTITINGAPFTFKTTLSVPAVASEVAINTSFWQTVANLRAVLAKSVNPLVSSMTYVWVADGVTQPTIAIQRKNFGEFGNGFTLSSTSPAIFFPTEILAGGKASAKAFAIVTPSVNPTNNATLVMNGTTFTFKTTLTSPSVDTEILIGISTAATLAAAVVVLEASTDPLASLATYTATATALKVEADVVGATYGNKFSVSGSYGSGSANKFTITGTKLSGGQDLTQGDAILLNGIKFVFKVSPYFFNDILIGETLAETLANAVAVLNTSVNPGVSIANVSSGFDPDGGVTDTVLTIQADYRGVYGNAVSIATSGVAGVASDNFLSGGEDPKTRRVEVKSGVGTNLRESAGRLVLHPIDLPDNDFSEDVIVPLAATSGAIKYSFAHDKERIFPVEFVGYTDLATKVLFQIGDAIG